MSIKYIFSLILLYLPFWIVGCDSGNIPEDTANFLIFNEKELISKEKEILHYAVIISPVLGADVEVFSGEKKFYSTTTDEENGTWSIPQSIPFVSDLVRIVISGGESDGKTLQTPLCAEVSADTLREQNLTIGLVSTLMCSEDKVFSPYNDGEITVLPSPYDREGFEDYLMAAGIGEVFWDSLSLVTWKTDDYDGDGLENWQEMLMGLNPASKDSDRDTLEDGEEIEKTGTDPVQSDTDGDYIPDNIELSMMQDPLNADENNNGVKDGLEGDPFFGYQWYIYNPESVNICTTTNVKTVPGNDLNILPLYSKTWGSSHGEMIVQIVDGGVDSRHEDLQISLYHSINSVTGDSDPSPVEGISSDPVQIFYRGHGTAVAGIIGAIGKNGKGVRGVAPSVTLAGSNWLESQRIETLEAVWYMAEGADDIVVSNNSWGARLIDDKSYEYLMQSASEDLRGGKGRIFVFASGNDREQHGNANLSYLINNPYAIAVAALNHEEKFASYSTGGSNILTCAYGGEHYYDSPTIMTTFSSGLSMYDDMLYGRVGPITIDEDVDRSYTYAMNGTSAAAPMVSGALALVLDMCPDLTWRDVRWLIAHTAVQVDGNNSSWVENGIGLWHSNDYGFGKINAAKMVEKCTSIDHIFLPKLQTVEIEKSVDLPIPDTKENVIVDMAVDQNITVEWIGLTMGIDHPYAGDITIELISPSGTVSHIIEPNFLKSNIYQNGFRFSTVAMMGESSYGLWKVRVRDELDGDEGVLAYIKLEIWGH